MRVVSIADIVEVNKALVAEGIPCKVHLRDACGKQTMWLELNDASAADGAQAREAVSDLFAKRGYELEFDSVEGVNFWVK